MANFIYKKTKEALFKGNINIQNNSLKLAFVKTTVYTPNESTDEFLSIIPESAITYRSETISNVTNTLGTLDASDIDINYPGTSFQALVLYQVGTNDGNSRLISFIDTSSGLPFVGLGSTIGMSVQWDNSSTKIITI